MSVRAPSWMTSLFVRRFDVACCDLCWCERLGTRAMGFVRLLCVL
jgi:hypothetical protein